MKMIVAVDENWGIGCNNKLLARIPEDLQHFKKHTVEKIVVMGRKNLESLPGGKPLPNRQNIVITRNKDYKVEGALVLNSIEEAVEELNKYNKDDIYIIGGGTIYEQFMDYCSQAVVTKIQESFEADTFFPNLDKNKDWEISEISDIKGEAIKFTYNIYNKI